MNSWKKKQVHHLIDKGSKAVILILAFFALIFITSVFSFVILEMLTLLVGFGAIVEELSAFLSLIIYNDFSFNKKPKINVTGATLLPLLKKHASKHEYMRIKQLVKHLDTY